MVDHDVLKLQVKRLRDILNARTDEVFGLENRKGQLEITMQERETEIRVYRYGAPCQLFVGSRSVAAHAQVIVCVCVQRHADGRASHHGGGAQQADS